jgi:hypothetical protein
MSSADVVVGLIIQYMSKNEDVPEGKRCASKNEDKCAPPVSSSGTDFHAKGS